MDKSKMEKMSDFFVCSSFFLFSLFLPLSLSKRERNLRARKWLTITLGFHIHSDNKLFILFLSMSNKPQNVTTFVMRLNQG